MDQRVRAVYRGGAFVLQEPCDVPEGTEVELLVHGPLILSPEVTDPEERARLLKAIVERMQRNPIPIGAQRFTREELHPFAPQLSSQGSVSSAREEVKPRTNTGRSF